MANPDNIAKRLLAEVKRLESEYPKRKLALQLQQMLLKGELTSGMTVMEAIVKLQGLVSEDVETT